MTADHNRAKLYDNTTASHRNLQSKRYIVNLGWIDIWAKCYNAELPLLFFIHFYLLFYYYLATKRGIFFLSQLVVIKIFIICLWCPIGI